MFIERADLFLKLMNSRWPRTEPLVEGMLRVLKDHGIVTGRALDLCCGNGRVCVHMARRGFIVTGIDISKVFLDDARRKAEEQGVAPLVRFVEGDVRRLKDVVGPVSQRFDVVTSVWTSVGYFTEEEDIEVFKQAKTLCKDGAVLIVADTAHSSRWLGQHSTPYTDLGDMVMMEEPKYDPITSTMRNKWSFYRKEGPDLKFIDQVGFEIRIYSVSELSSILDEAGWQVKASYGSLSTLEPVTPFTGLNLVAVAR